MEVDILVTTKDRHTEIALLMQALRTQTHKEWNLFILDNASGTPLLSNYVVQCMINRLRIEGHAVIVHRQNVSYGACHARNYLNKLQLEQGTAPLSMRLDDDVIPDVDYIEKLVKVIEQGYDIASGVTPLIAHPFFVRDNVFLNNEINKVRINEQGDILEFGDDCGYCYINEQVLPAGHFRSCALYKSEINKIKYPDNLSQYGFREESFFSLKCRMQGYKIGVNTSAKVLHFQTPSGGGRNPNQQQFAQNCQSDDLIFRDWVKKQYLSKKLKV